MTESKIQMDQIRSTSATVTDENIRAGSQKKSSLSPAEGLQGASPDATCTCPSGDGYLVHPCPAHPAPVEQAGGDERAAFKTAYLAEFGCDADGDDNMAHSNTAWRAWKMARTALAQPFPVLPPFAEKVLAKLRRFYDCASDFESGGVDIGRHWLDLLTQLGLLNRVQRSPALWEITQQGEDLLGTQQPSPAQAEHANSGYDQLWGWFGLSRSAYVVLPRVMMHAMPDDWQGRFAELMDEWGDHWPNQPDITAHVQIKQNNRFISTPPWLLNYRHPDHNQLNAMRGKDEL